MSLLGAAPLIRWSARHGLPGAVLRMAARRGEPHARLACDPGLRADPYPFYAGIRARAPIVPGRLALVTARHPVVAMIVRGEDFRVGFPPEFVPAPVRFALRHAVDDTVLGPLDPPSLLAVDGAEHTRHRRLVARAFTPRVVADLRPRVARIAADLLDELDGCDEVELVSGYAAKLPVLVIAEVLGVPAEMQTRFLQWGHAIAPTLDLGVGYRRFRRSEIALRQLRAWLLEHFARLRAQPGDDVLSHLVAAGAAPGEDTAALDDTELCAVAGLVLAAGFETTVNLLGNGTVLLARHRDQLCRLLADPTLWPNAVEEVLRVEAPVQNTARYAAVDTEVAGIGVPAGSVVALLLGGANRDPEVFADPDRFDVARSNARDHLAFSGGPHYCLGAALARLEGEVGLRALFERHPDLTPAAPGHRRPTRTLRGWDRLPMHLDGTGRPRAATAGRAMGLPPAQ